MAIQSVLEHLPCQRTHTLLRHSWLGLGQGRSKRSPRATARNAELQAYPGHTEYLHLSKIPYTLHGKTRPRSRVRWIHLAPAPLPQLPASLTFALGSHTKCHCPVFCMACASSVAWASASKAGGGGGGGHSFRGRPTFSGGWR